MRSLSLNPNGIIAPTKSTLHTGSPIKALRNPSTALRKIDRAKAGDQLHILVSRCLASDSLVLMSSGLLKPIQDISPGDFVIGQDGKQKRIIEKFHNGIQPELISFRTTRMFRPLVCTPNHKILVLDLRETHSSNLSYYLRKHRNCSDQIKWLTASELTKDTYPLTPENFSLFKPTSIIDLAAYTGKRSKITEDFIVTSGRLPKSRMLDIASELNVTFWQVAEVSSGRSKCSKPQHKAILDRLQLEPSHKKNINRFLKPSYDLGLFFGAFLGDGTARLRVSGGEVGFSLNGDYPEDLEKISKTITSLFGQDIHLHYRVRKNSKCIDIMFSSSSVAKMLAPFGSKIDKQLPPEFWFDDHSYLRGILDGLQMTDGSSDYLVCNTSPNVINLAYIIAEYLGHNPKTYCEKKVRSSITKSSRVISGKHKAMYVRYLCNKSNNNEEVDKIYGFRVSKITSLEKISGKSTETYDIEVDDHSHAFIANNIVVHNTAGGIGDVLMTLPTVKQIRKQYNCKLDYVTDFDYLNGALPKVLQGNPHIDHVFDYKSMSEEEKEQYDAVVELTCPCTVHEQPHAEPINRIDLFARHAGVRLEDTSIDYYITKEELIWAQEWIAARGFSRNKLFIVQAHSSTSRRDLPHLKLQRAIMEILKSDPSYKAIIVTHSTDSVKNNWNLYGTAELRDFDIRHIAAVMYFCELVLCQDSAILHLASALHKKTCTFFGPTDPRARVNYHPEAVAICPGRHLFCAFCWYSPSCNNTFPCWKRIEEQLIVDVCKSLLQNKPLPNSEDLVYFGNSQTRNPSAGELL